jgi:intracellular septation protein A
VFVAFYAITKSAAVAAGLAIAIGLGRIAYLKFRNVPIDTMQWLSLFLVVVFGGATLLTRNPLFVMLKPTLIYAAVGTVMLKPGWMSRYIPPAAQVHGADVTVAFGYLWAALMFATAGANLAVAHWAGPATWAWFIATFPIASKLVLIAAQYAATRSVVRRRIRAA